MKNAKPTTENNHIDNRTRNLGLFTFLLSSDKYKIDDKSLLESPNNSISKTNLTAKSDQIAEAVILANKIDQELVKELETQKIRAIPYFHGDINQQINEYLRDKIMNCY